MLSFDEEKTRIKSVKSDAAQAVTIVPYEAKNLDTFVRLNRMWIEEHWKLEEEDIRVLSHPQENIIDKGGHILVAQCNGEPAGVVAVMPCPYEGFDWEFAKFAVDPAFRGNGIGKKLGRAAVDGAREIGCRHLFIESNKLLKLAIHVYEWLGFKEMPDFKSGYCRGDYCAEMWLSMPLLTGG